MGCVRGRAHSELSRRRHIQFQQSVIVIKVISTKYAAYLRGVRLYSHCIRVLKLNKSNKSNAASTMSCMFHPVFLQWKITPHLVIQVRWCWYADILLTMIGGKLLAVWSELKIKINCKWKVERSYIFCQIQIKQPEFRLILKKIQSATTAEYHMLSALKLAREQRSWNSLLQVVDKWLRDTQSICRCR